MRKFLMVFTILIGLFFVSSIQAANGATISFSPDAKQVKVGDTFNIKVMVDPKGGELDTVRAAVSFPTDKLEAMYFDLDSLFPNPSPNNFIDNDQGLVYQGGAIFGGKTSRSGTFGTITFKAKSRGEATIAVTNESRLIRAGEEKIDLSSSGKVVVTISEAEVKEVTAEEKVNQVIVTSASHPDQSKWYSNDNVELNWKMSEDSDDAVSYLYSWSEDPESEPATFLNKDIISKKFEKIIDGIWYLNIKAKLADQQYSDVASYKVMVDTGAPYKLSAILEPSEIVENESAELRFGTIDQTSGIAYYDLAIDGADFTKQTSPYTLEDLKPGEHTVIVRAIDQAGNVMPDVLKLTVYPREKTAVEVFWQKYYQWIIGMLALVIILVIRKKLRK